MNYNSKRNYTLDLAKGMTIFFMLWGHCIQYCYIGSNLDFFENPVFKFIYSFHMPLFMLLSGYFFFYSFRKRNLKDLIVHRGKTLICTIIFGGILNYFLSYFIFDVLIGDFSFFESIKLLISSSSSLWFLWSVLFSSAFVAIVCKKTDSLIKQLLFLSLFGIVFLFLPHRDLDLFMYPYFLLGFYFSKYKEKISEHHIKTANYIFTIIFLTMILFFDKKHFIYTTGLFDRLNFFGQINTDIFRWLIGLSGSIFMLNIVQLISKISKSNNFINSITEKIVYLGVNSLEFYCISTSVLSFWLPKIVNYIILPLNDMKNILVNNMFVYNFVLTPLLAILFSLFIYLILFIIRKIKLNKIIFGR